MICPKCGKEIVDGSTFCNFCGTRLTGWAMRKWLPLAVGALTFIVGLTVGLVLLLSNKNNEPISRAQTAVDADLPEIETAATEAVEAVTVATDVVDSPYYTWDSVYYETVEVGYPEVYDYEYDDEYVDGYNYSARAEAAVRAIEAASSLDEIVAIEQEYSDLSMDDFLPEQQARIMKAAQKFGL